MAKLRSINTKFWDDSYILTLDPVEKLLFLYLLTTPLTNICGAYEISLRRIAFDTGLDGETVLRIFERFEKARKITYKDGWVVIHNFIKNQTLNPKVIAGIKTNLANAPDWAKILVKIDRLYTDYDSLSHSNSNFNLNSNLNAISELRKQKQELIRKKSI